MLQIIDDLPDSVLGLEASGTVSADDYRQILAPALESLLSRHARIRLLYVLGPDFQGFTGGATWQDAKVGMSHFSAFERVAVVTDHDWLENLVRAFGFLVPGEVRTFECDELEEARAWIVDPRSGGALEHELHADAGVLVLRPKDELEVGDFQRVAAEVDPFIAERGGLAGLMIVADEFPGWDDFAAMTAHFRFVREHHRDVRRVALVTSDRFLAAVPRFARYFLRAEVRRFAPEDEAAAFAWVGGGG